MEESSNSSRKRMMSDEEDVAETLLLLSRMTTSYYCFRFTSWGCKRRRSAIDVPVSWPRPNPNSPPPPPKAEAFSPATPLSFSAVPTESDDKDDSAPRPPPTNHPSLKKKKEHYLQTIQDLKRDNHLLAGEIKNVQSYFDRVKDFNSKLKARKLELMSDGASQKRAAAAAAAAAPAPPQIPESEGVAQQASCDQQTTSYPCGSDAGNRNSNENVGPIEIPDLNLPATEVEEEECGEALDSNNVSWALEAQDQAQHKGFRLEGSKNPST